jgi:hypothetical protein
LVSLTGLCRSLFTDDGPIVLAEVLFHDREGFTAISSGAWSRSVKSGPVRVAAGWRCCRVTAEAGAALRARGVGQQGRAARDAGGLWDVNPFYSLALGS